MSAKDVCALPLLPQIIAAGASALKIEGRNRGPEYVAKVVSAYRAALNAITDKNYSLALADKFLLQLREAYNKDFSHGYLVNYPHHQRCNVYGSRSTQEKVLLGKVANYYRKLRVAEIRLEAQALKLGDKIGISGPTTGYLEIEVKEMRDDQGVCQKAAKGEVISLPVPQQVRENDKVYLLKKRKT
jgi:putative protease